MQASPSHTRLRQTPLTAVTRSALGPLLGLNEPIPSPAGADTYREVWRFVQNTRMRPDTRRSYEQSTTDAIVTPECRLSPNSTEKAGTVAPAARHACAQRVSCFSPAATSTSRLDYSWHTRDAWEDTFVCNELHQSSGTSTRTGTHCTNNPKQHQQRVCPSQPPAKWSLASQNLNVDPIMHRSTRLSTDSTAMTQHTAQCVLNT